MRIGCFENLMCFGVTIVSKVLYPFPLKALIKLLISFLCLSRNDPKVLSSAKP